MDQTIVHLARADFFELTALMLAHTLAEREAEAARERCLDAQRQAQLKLTELGTAHGFDPRQTFRLDPTQLALVPQGP